MSEWAQSQFLLPVESTSGRETIWDLTSDPKNSFEGKAAHHNITPPCLSANISNEWTHRMTVRTRRIHLTGARGTPIGQGQLSCSCHLDYVS